MKLPSLLARNCRRETHLNIRSSHFLTLAAALPVTHRVAMKASMKFREEEKPLFRAKAPFKILGFPFQSSIVAGEWKELSLNLSTFFESGSSLKVAYRPNDSFNPFCVAFKTGTAHFGSPISGALNMSANFNLIGGGLKPSLFIHFKPQFNGFTVKKVQALLFKKHITGVGGVADEDAPMVVDPSTNDNKISNSPLESPAAGLVKGALSDVEITATTAVPLRKNATLSFRWGVRFPAMEESSLVLMKTNDSTAGISLQKLPCLIVNKIGIACNDSSKVGPPPIDAGEAFLGVKKQLKDIRADNEALMKAMDDLKGEFSNGLGILRAESGTLKKATEIIQSENGALKEALDSLNFQLRWGFPRPGRG